MVDREHFNHLTEEWVVDTLIIIYITYLDVSGRWIVRFSTILYKVGISGWVALLMLKLGYSNIKEEIGQWVSILMGTQGTP